MTDGARHLVVVGGSSHPFGIFRRRRRERSLRSDQRAVSWMSEYKSLSRVTARHLCRAHLVFAVAWVTALGATGCGFRPLSRSSSSTRVASRTHRILVSAQSRVQEGRTKAALAQLEELQPFVEGSPYERALVARRRAHLLLGEERYDEAIAAFEMAAEGERFPENEQRDLRYNLGQLYLRVGRYQDAATLLQAWVETEADPPPGARVQLGHALYALKRYVEVIAQLELALESEEPLGGFESEDREPWYQLLLAAYLAIGDGPATKETLLRMVARFAHRQVYWLQLSNAQLQLGDIESALASLELAHDIAPLEGESLRQLARLNLQMGAPHRAARLIEAALNENRVDPSMEMLHVQVEYLLAAREYERALATVDRAASLYPASLSPRLRRRRAELLIQLERWGQAVALLQDIVRDQEGREVDEEHDRMGEWASFLLGVAAYMQGDFAMSTSAFRSVLRAGATAQNRGLAKRWLERVSYRQAIQKRGGP